MKRSARKAAGKKAVPVEPIGRFAHLLPNPKGIVCRDSSTSPLPEWRPDPDKWCRESFTHTITVLDLRHWLPHLNWGTYGLVEAPVQSEGLYVWCERGLDEGPIRAEFGRPLAIGEDSCLMLTTSGHRRTITPERHPFRFRVTGIVHHSFEGPSPYARSETPVRVPPVPEVTQEQILAPSWAALQESLAKTNRVCQAIMNARTYIDERVKRTSDDDLPWAYWDGYTVLDVLAVSALQAFRDIATEADDFLERFPALAVEVNVGKAGQP